MPTPERPFDGDDPRDDGDASYEWLDEWLCEYVDGTMDPSLEVVFEEYVEANPELKAHVQRLRQTRELLGGCDFSDEPPASTQANVCTEVEEDLLHDSSSLPHVVSEHLLATLSIASSVAVALVVGFLAGSMVGEPGTVVPTSAASAADNDRSTTEQIAPRPDGSVPTLQSGAPLFSTEDTVFPPGTTELSMEADSATGPSTFTTVDAR